MPNNSNIQIMKNTLYLYLRMFFVMAVSLYTSRIVLDVLGIDDYGLYNVIAGIVVMLSILNNCMITATQRFLTFEIGAGNEERVLNTFCMSMTAHIGISFLLLLIGETVGLWYVINHLSFPEGRDFAAIVTYQCSLFILIASIIRSPYNASIIAYERMSIFAVISILEIFLKLLIVFIIEIIDSDKLILYSLLLCLVELIIFVVNRSYCKTQFRTCLYRFYIDWPYFKKLISFLGWNFLGGISTLGTQQANNLIVNSFFGVTLNASFGVSYQISNAMNQFVTNFQTAFRPQIVKLYAQRRLDEMHLLLNRSALISFYLIFVISFPIYIYINKVLGFWLKVVPEYTPGLSRLLIISGCLDAIQAPLWIGISATGKIKQYQIWTSLLFFLTIPASILCMKLGMSPYWIIIVRLIIGVIMAIYRTIHSNFLFGFSVSVYIKSVIIRIFLSSATIYILWLYLKDFIIVDGLFSFTFVYIIILSLSLIVISLIGISTKDRIYVFNLIKDKFHK